MLRSEVKEGLLLLIFSLLMYEVLTTSTMAFAAFAALAVFFGWKFPRWLRNSVAILVLISYWFTYGKVIDPEVGLNFLTSVMALKLLEKEGLRDRYMVFFGLLLLISAGSLFERTLTYVFFFGISFMVLLRDFYRSVGYRARLKDLALALLWVLPLTAVVFFLVPRLMGLPFQQNFKRPGEMGYTPDVNISETESLQTNDTPAFQALVDRPVPRPLLYWRGNVLFRNDGWNWVHTDGTSVAKKNSVITNPEGMEVRQTVRLLGREDFIFALDLPTKISWNNEDHHLSTQRTLKQSRWKWVNRYEVVSRLSSKPVNDEDLKRNLQVVLNKEERQWIHENFKGKNLQELQTEIGEHFRAQKFTYSLSPGSISSFHQFMQEDRIGFCSHFASATAIILRAKGVPARLVSGYLGGDYNRFGGHYLVTQNDAHVWVEAMEDGHWRRLDPTEWIAPERVQLGGEAFMSAVASPGVFSRLGVIWSFGALRDLKQWFEQWDFRFYSWLEQMDHYGQQAWLARLKLKRQWLYVLAPLILALFTFAYAVGLARKNRRKELLEHEVYWNEFLGKLRKRGLELPLSSVREADDYLKHMDHPDKELILAAWTPLLAYSFAAGDGQQLREKLKSL